ncbi:hypothetical protein [Porphyromonas pogonae]|uniref:hypothetical protein n=1 Tax=Porphyromonas pogonae TaxID=867595 RepID=UPI002E7A1055|nr:hypothetical protein [Porphyromonas pogonae]
MITKFGVSYLSLSCNSDIIEAIIDTYVDKCNEDFSFKDVCNYIKFIAEEKGYFEKEKNTEYSQIELQRKDIYKINIILWKKIWDKILIVDFDKSRHRPYPNEFYFIKIGKQV